MWGQLGATVTLESQEWATFLNTRKNGDYQVARNGWLGDYNDPISFLDMWITGGGNNDAQWSNAEFDSLIKQIKSSGDAEARMEMMHQAEDIIFDEWMLCPIYYYVDIYMAQQNLENLSTSPLGFKFFMNASNGTDTLKVCTGPDPDTIDPALNSAVDGGTMIDHAFEGLYTVAYGTTPTPGQAESVEISEDGLTYTFHLREGLKWSDGTPLTAHDFVYSWQRAVTRPRAPTTRICSSASPATPRRSTVRSMLLRPPTLPLPAPPSLLRSLFPPAPLRAPALPLPRKQLLSYNAASSDAAFFCTGMPGAPEGRGQEYPAKR